MPDVKISELPAAASVSGSDVIIVNQGVDTKKATLSQALVNALTTSQIAGLSTSAPAALATAPVVGLSTFAARSDHQHIFPTLGDIGAQAALTTSAPLALSLGGTGQITRQAAMDALAGAVTLGQYLRGNGTDVVMSAIQAGDVPTLNQNTTGTAGNVTGIVLEANGGTGESAYSNGQLLIGNTAGGLTKATLTAGSNVTITNGDGAITIASTGGGGGAVAGTYLEFFEHFLSTTVLSGNLAFASTGGTNTLQNTSGLGIVVMTTGAVASANQQARITQPGNVSLIGNSAARTIFRVAQGGSTWFDGTLTGAARFGWGDNVAAESANGIYFRVQNGQVIEFVTRSSNVETATNTGVSFALNVFRSLEILINSAGTEVVAKIDGTTVATHTTNIPTARVFLFGHVNRVSTTGTSVAINLDFIYSNITPNTPYF